MRAGPPAGLPSWRSRCKGPWRPASWNCRPQETRSRALRRTSPTCWLTRAGSCQRAPATSLSPPAKTAKAGLPRQYDAGGPSQPTGRLQGKRCEGKNKKLKNYTQLFHRIFYTEKLLCTGAFTHRRLYTQKLVHTEAFTHRNFCTEKPLHTDAFPQKNRFHRAAFTRFNKSQFNLSF